MSLSSIDWRKPGAEVSNQLNLMINNLIEMTKNAQIQNIGESNLVVPRRLKTVIFLFNSTLKMKIFKQPSPAFWCVYPEEKNQKSKTMPSSYRWDSEGKHWHLLCPTNQAQAQNPTCTSQADLPNGKERFMTRNCNFFPHSGSCSVFEQGLRPSKHKHWSKNLHWH